MSELAENLKEHLLSLGFERKLPWQYHNDSYYIVDLGRDSNDFPVWSIVSKRYDSSNYRGIIMNEEEFDFIYARVKEDYNREDDEIEKLKEIN